MFCLATFEVHTNHDEHPGQSHSQSQNQQCDCCLQCCPSHNLAPTSRKYLATEIILTTQSFSPKEENNPSILSLGQIFRPPII